MTEIKNNTPNELTDEALEQVAGGSTQFYCNSRGITATMENNSTCKNSNSNNVFCRACAYSLSTDAISTSFQSLTKPGGNAPWHFRQERKKTLEDKDMDCNEKKTPTPKDKIRNEKPAEEAAELTDEELAQVSGGEGDVIWRCTNPQCKFYMKTLYYTLTSKCS